MKKFLIALSMTIAMSCSGNVFAGAHDGGGGPKAAGDGHCNYTQENMFAGPFKVCQMPTDAALCEEFGNTDDNADAVAGRRRVRDGSGGRHLRHGRVEDGLLRRRPGRPRDRLRLPGRRVDQRRRLKTLSTFREKDGLRPVFFLPDELLA